MWYNIAKGNKMKKLKVYLDTSIINFAVDDDNPEGKRITLEMFDEIKKGEYEIFISGMAILEINRAPQEIAEKLWNIIRDLNPEELALNDEVEALADKYIEEGIIPAKYRNDALHIAAATINGLDVIVSWNFEHIVKLKTKREVAGINVFMGYREIDIYSPLEVVGNV